MIKSSRCAAAAMAAMLLAGPAIASDPLPKAGDDLSIYKETELWTIYADATRGSCLAERVDSQGNVVQMGLTSDKSAAYVGVFTEAEDKFVSGQTISIAVDGRVFAGEATGVRSKKLKGGQSGGYIITNNPDLINAIANGQTLVAFPERTQAFEVDLTGTKAAIAEIEACTAGLSG